MQADLRELWNYRELLLIFVQRDLKVRYKNSMLGFGWSLLNPLFQVLTITLVLQFLGVGQRQANYHMYVFCAMLPWLFFNTSTMDSTMALVSFHHLMRRTYFPRELAPIAVVIANLIHFGLATGVFLVYSLANSLFWWTVLGRLDIAIQPTVLLIPIPMLGLALLVTGVALFVSVWTLYFEDIRFILDSGMKILYWLVPVLYIGEQILLRDPWGRGKLLHTLYMLNPLAGLITGFQRLTMVPTKLERVDPVTQQVLYSITARMDAAHWGFMFWGVAAAALVALAGHRYFTSRKWKLAERG